jgi:hypothetical protein
MRVAVGALVDEAGLASDRASLLLGPQPRPQRRQRLEQAQRHREVAAGVLPHLIERCVDQAGEAERAGHHPQRSASIVAERRGQRVPRQLGQSRAEPLDAVERREWIVDPRRERPDRDLHELLDRELGVLLVGRLGTQEERASQASGQVLGHAAGDHEEQRLPAPDEVARTDGGPHAQVPRLGGAHQDRLVDRLEVAARLRLDEPGRAREVRRQALLRVRMRRRSAAEPSGVRPVPASAADPAPPAPRAVAPAG